MLGAKRMRGLNASVFFIPYSCHTKIYPSIGLTSLPYAGSIPFKLFPGSPGSELRGGICALTDFLSWRIFGDGSA